MDLPSSVNAVRQAYAEARAVSNAGTMAALERATCDLVDVRMSDGVSVEGIIVQLKELLGEAGKPRTEDDVVAFAIAVCIAHYYKRQAKDE